MRTVIRDMKDCIAFAKEFKNGDTWCFPDSRLSMPTGGTTEIRKRGDKFYQYSSGQNWWDKQQEIIESIGSFIWKHRADIRMGNWI